MNLASGTILLFILFVFPALVFRRFYYSGEFSQQYFKSNAFQVFMVSIVPGFLFQSFYYLLISQFVEGGIDLNFIVVLLGSGTGQEYFDTFETIKGNLLGLVLYNLSLWLLAGILGYLSRVFVRRLKLDRKYKFFRFQNIWHYVLRGEILDFPGNPGNADNMHLSVIDVLVDVDNKTIIYSGLLDDYHLTKESGGLDYIYLTDARKRYLDESSKKDWEKINGRYLVVPFSKVINLNISYYSLESLEQQE